MKRQLKPHFLHVFNTFDPGGAQTRFAALANHFGPSLRHSIIAMDGHFSYAEKLAADLDITLLPIEARKKSLVGNLLAFRTVLSKLCPDRLITHNWGTIEWALANRLQSIPHIHIEDGFGPDEANKQFFRRILARRIFLRKSLVVVPSLTLARIARNDWHIPARRLKFVPNGIDCARFARHPPEMANKTLTYKWQGDGAIIGTIAALRSEKNLPRLLRAFAGVLKKTPCRLVIVGDGPQATSLKALAAELDITGSVTFTGHIADPSDIYRQFDIFALTSDTEQMPYTVLEAMAASCPIVATDVGDIRHMVAVPNRPFVVAKDDGAVACALTELLGGRAELRRAIGAANAQHVERAYDQRAMFRAFTELYQLHGLIS